VEEVVNKTLVTSGVYERYFESGGKTYHHILSTKTGYPVENDLSSVTIIGDDSAAADALATTLFALGSDGGSSLLRKHFSDFSAIFIFRDGTIERVEALR
jgi:thiamine biosynthesis lipoprotein